MGHSTTSDHQSALAVRQEGALAPSVQILSLWQEFKRMKSPFVGCREG